MKHLTTILDRVASELEARGMVRLATEVDVVANTMEKEATNQSIQISRSAIIGLVGKKDWEGLKTYIYDSIRRMPGWENKAQGPEYKRLLLKYREIAEKSDASNPAWAQWNIRKDIPKSNDNNFKLYYTVADDSVENMITHLKGLSDALTPVTKTHNTNLDFKIPASYTGFLGENDRLVVHFSNKDAKGDADRAVKTWASSSGVKFGTRTHSFGQDVGKESFGVRIAKTMSEWCKTHTDSGKYTVEQVAEGCIKYLPTLLKDIDG